MQIKFYYQIDFIDELGCANYINTFNDDELEKAKEHYRILSNALACLEKTKRKFVLDKYAYIYDTKTKSEVENTEQFVCPILPL